MSENRKHFKKGTMIECPDGLGLDLKAARQTSGWTKDEVAKAIVDPTGTSPSISWISHLEDGRHDKAEGIKISGYGLRGVVTFLTRHGNSASRIKYRRIHERMPTADDPFPPRSQTSAPDSPENLDDRMINAFTELNEEDKWMITSIAEKLSRASKLSAIVVEAAKEAV